MNFIKKNKKSISNFTIRTKKYLNKNDHILCQFSNKEVKFLKQFFDEFKNKNTEKNNFLINLSFCYLFNIL